MPLLTKSKYIIGIQCPKYLWMVFHEKDKIPEHDKSTQFRFDQGNLVGQLAKKLYPEGINISTKDFMGNINQTRILVDKRATMFEAGFMNNSLYSRVDILKPAPKGQWDIIEVKSSTSVKDINLHDISFQKHCLECYGLKIRKCFLMYLNNKYIKKGKISPKNLFVTEEITAFKYVKIKEMFDIINSNVNPDTTIGRHCADPYGCPLEGECWGFLPEQNVFDLYRGTNAALELFENEVLEIKNIPEDFKLNDKQSIQKNCAITNKPYIQKEGIKDFIKTLNYPLYYLDFETHSPAIPIYDGMRPYQRIPFQFSLHIVQEDGTSSHHSFLAEGKEDPRPKFLEELKKLLDDKGSIVVYNQTFEISMLNELAVSFPEYNEVIKQYKDRIVDLLVPFRNFHYYHPKQAGSASIKKVLPALTGKSYDDLGINQGNDASLSFVRMIFGEDSKEEKDKIKADLEKYCKLDTEGMIWIVDELRKLIE